MKTILFSSAWTAVAIIATLTGCSSGQDNEAPQKELLVLSNKLAEATSKLSEREAAVATLKVTSELKAADFTVSTNRVHTLKTELNKALEVQRHSATQLQAREAELAAARDQMERGNQRLVNLDNDLKGLRGELAAAQARVKAVE